MVPARCAVTLKGVVFVIRALLEINATGVEMDIMDSPKLDAGNLFKLLYYYVTSNSCESKSLYHNVFRQILGKPLKTIS